MTQKPFELTQKYPQNLQTSKIFIFLPPPTPLPPKKKYSLKFMNLNTQNDPSLRMCENIRVHPLLGLDLFTCLQNIKGQTWFSCSLYSFHSEHAEQKSSALEHLCWRTPEYSVFRGGVDRTVT